MLHLFTLKIVAAIIIFFLTIFSGLLPIRFAKRHVHILCLGDAFASGVFLSAALLHLLPDATEGFQALKYNYPLAQLILIATFIFLLILERGVAFYGKQHNSNNITPWLLVLVLTIHSLVEGAAIGITCSTVSAAVIFFAIIAHKGSESFALATNLYRHLFSSRKITRILLLFSLMTPLGVLIASSISGLLHTSSGCMSEPIFDAIAAGTFLYIGTEHMVEGSETYEGIGQILALITGIALMAVVAIWV